jgi:hypothetical protein
MTGQTPPGSAQAGTFTLRRLPTLRSPSLSECIRRLRETQITEMHRKG